MEKVFIAGGTGMLGAATARSFASKGVEVVVSSRKEHDPIGQQLQSESDLIAVEKVDLLDLESVRAVFGKHNFSGVVMVMHTHQYALTRDKNNEIYPIVLNCLETARKTGVKRVVFGGSIAVYGGLTPPFVEGRDFPPEVSAASKQDESVMKKFEVATKRALELIVLDYGQDFQMGLSIPPGSAKPEPHELEVVILRAPMMFGPGYQALGSPLGVAAHFAAGKLPNFKGHIGYGGAPIEAIWAGLNAMPVSYVKDNADCIQTAMMAEHLPNRIYNVSGGFSTSPRDQLRALIAACPGIEDRIGIAPEDLPEPTVDLGYYTGLFERDFGWQSPYSLETAFTDYIDWLRQHSY